jgi:hypothetical protein
MKKVLFYSLTAISLFSILSGCVTKNKHSKKSPVSIESKADSSVQKSGKVVWPFSITYDSDCKVRFTDETIQQIVNKIPLSKNRIIRNMFINSPDTVSVWIVPTTTFYSGKERAFFLIETKSGEWVLK